MSTRESKRDQLIDQFVVTRNEILRLAASLGPQQGSEIFLGTWSTSDLLAHLAGWDCANKEAALQLLRGELPAFYAMHDRDWQTYNAQLVAVHAKDSYAALLGLVQETHSALVTFLRSMPADDFSGDHGVRWKGYRVTIERLLRAEIDDEKTHLEQLQAFVSATAQE